MIHSPEKAAQTLDCVNPIRADAEVRLNTIHSQDSLMLSLSSLYTPDIIPTLVDSGSSHCFIDTALYLVMNHRSPMSLQKSYTCLMEPTVPSSHKKPTYQSNSHLEKPYLLGFWSLCWIRPAPPFLDTTGLPTTTRWLTGLQVVSPSKLLFKTLLFRCRLPRLKIVLPTRAQLLRKTLRNLRYPLLLTPTPLLSSTSNSLTP